MKSIELKENGSIYQILGFDSTQVGLEQLHNRAKLCVQDVDFEDAKIMGKKVRELPSVDVQQKLAEGALRQSIRAAGARLGPDQADSRGSGQEPEPCKARTRALGSARPGSLT